jgi:hypothetical protein
LRKWLENAGRKVLFYEKKEGSVFQIAEMKKQMRKLGKLRKRNGFSLQKGPF